VERVPCVNERSILGIVLTAALVAFGVAVAENAVVSSYFVDSARATTDFSAAFLERKLRALERPPQRTIFLGDSVVWGFRLPADRTAVSLIAARGVPVDNLAFKAGSPANYYALTRLMLERGIRPKRVVVEINQKTFNQADSAYQALHPALATLAYPLLTTSDRTLLGLRAPADGIASRLDRTLSSIWLVYAMRSDIRDALYGENDVTQPGPPTPEAFEGTYDLAPLTADNVAVHFLRAMAIALHASGIPVVAFFTPTNHTLLHEYIDNPQYRANAAYLEALLRGNGAKVLDFDALLPAADFLDNDHLTVEGQRRLAAALEAEL
jgi:hypothetical protein